MADKTSGSQQKVDESERSEFEDEGKVDGKAVDAEKSSGRVFAETTVIDKDKAVPYSGQPKKPDFAHEKEDDFEKKKGEENFSDGADAAAKAIPWNDEGYRDQTSRNASQRHQPGPPAPSSSLPRPPSENQIALLTREFATFRREMTNELRQVREDNSVLRNEIRQFMQALAPRNAVSGQQPIGDMSGRSVASYGAGLQSDSRNRQNAVAAQPGNGSDDREEQQSFRDVPPRSVASHGGSLESDGSNQEIGAVARRGNGGGDGEDDPNASGPNSPEQL